MKKLKVLDLFSGAGGLSLGFLKAGYEIIGAVDFDHDAIETHRHNFDSLFEFHGDITNITSDFIKDNLSNVEIIIGGPPCQGFSSANRYESDEEDPRNKLFYEYLRFVEIINPSAFVIENVPGILTKENGYAKNRINQITTELGYNVRSKILDASKYGVPQTRKRAFFIGIRKDYKEIFSFDEIEEVDKVVTVEEALANISTSPLTINKEYRDFVFDSAKKIIENHEKTLHNEKVLERIKYVPQGGNWRDVPENLWDTQRENRHSSAYRRLSNKSPSITIDTGHMNYFHPIENRIPTVRESARIQSFPDSFVFKGSKGAQYKQVGNAVPPLLAYKIAKELLKKIHNPYGIIDLFSGAGGFSLGFEQQGFKSILAIDYWKDAIETFNLNRDEKVGVNIDIHKFSDKDVKSLFSLNPIGIIGGPPCQGFSLVGTRDPGDSRNNLYLQYVRFVKLLKPKFFVLENVKGLLSMEKGFYKTDIISRFDKLGYNVNFATLKASDYGVPQSRERVFFIGLSKETFGNRFFDFDLLEKKKLVTTQDALGDLPNLDLGEDHKSYSKLPQNDFQHYLRDGCSEILNNEITHHTDKTKSVISMIPDGGNIKSIDKEFYKIRNYNNAFKRMDSKKPSSTIDCGHRNYFHYNENRVPTARESARIQSFPDNYVFKGSKTSQYTQIGNAVPVLLANEIARLVKMYLEGDI